MATDKVIVSWLSVFSMQAKRTEIELKKTFRQKRPYVKTSTIFNFIIDNQEDL